MVKVAYAILVMLETTLLNCARQIVQNRFFLLSTLHRKNYFGLAISRRLFSLWDTILEPMLKSLKTRSEIHPRV